MQMVCMGGSRGNAVQCLTRFASRFFGVWRNLRPPALWLYLTNDEDSSANNRVLFWDLSRTLSGNALERHVPVRHNSPSVEMCLQTVR